MPPDAAWPNLPAHGQFTAADHAAHTTPKGIAYPEDLIPGAKSHKFAKSILKVVRKPHLKTPTRRSSPRRKKKEPK
jgi:hypothetical protein